MTQNLRIDREGRVLHVTLSRPEKRNALTAEMCRMIAHALAASDTDRDTGAVLIDAEGPVFCSGVDLDELQSPEAASHVAVHDQLFTIGPRMRKPIIAAVAGAALAGGLALLANAHIVVASEASTFGMTEIRLGLFPFTSYSAIMRALGERRALELCLTGRVFGATEALSWGLVHYVAGSLELYQRARQIAEDVANSSAYAITRGFDFMHESRDLGDQDVRSLARRLRSEAATSADLTEGLEAARSRRRPEWPSLKGESESD
jgi:enoyl-CoA hydratase/carnithine racemase